MASTPDLLQGTLDLLVLKTLRSGRCTAGGSPADPAVVRGTCSAVNQGSLYPALRRLEDSGWVTSEWGLSENNRRARFYRLTPRGRRHLHTEAELWLRYAAAVTRVLRAEPSLG